MSVPESIFLIHSGVMENDAIYQAAIERLEALSQEKAELEQFLATYRRLSGEVDDVEAIPQEVSHGPASHENRWTTERIVDAVMTLLEEQGPLPLSTIYNGLLDRGVIIGGKKPRQNLGAKLSADFRLKSVKGRGWWFSDERPPPVSGLPAPIRDEEADEIYSRFLDDPHNAEGPAAYAEGPSQLNGVAGSYPA